MTFGVNELTADRRRPQNVPATEPPAMATAAALLDNLRRTPMLRGGKISERRLQLRDEIASAIEGEGEGVLPRLAKRIAFQLIFKFDESELGNQTTWRAI